MRVDIHVHVLQSFLKSIGLTIPRPKLPPVSPPNHISIADIAIATSPKLHTTLNKKRNKHMSFLRTSQPLKPLLTTRAFTTTARTMAPAKQEWLVILPDYTGKLAERNQVRAYVLS